jgi:hypothetical protein
MSSYYTENGERYDIGKLEIDLTNGIDINIRLASEEELVPFKAHLYDLKKRRESK